MKQTSFLLVLVLSFFSCKKDNPVPVPPVEKTISILNTVAVPGELVIAQASADLGIQPGSYVKVNGLQTSCFALPDNQLGFMLPEVPSGMSSIDFGPAGVSKVLELTVGSYTPIADPKQVVTEFVTEMDEIMVQLQSHIQNPVSALDPNYVELLDYLVQTVEDNFEDMTPAEQMQIAYLLRHNQPDDNDLALGNLNPDLYVAKNDGFNDPGETLTRTGERFAKNVIVAIPTLKAGFALAFLPSPALIDKIAAAGFLTIGLVAGTDALSNMKQIARLAGVADNITEVSEQKAELPLFADTKTMISARGNFRTLKSTDNKSAGIIGIIFKNITLLGELHNQATAIANKIIGWFPWKSPTVPAFNNPVGSYNASLTLNIPVTKMKTANCSNPAIQLSHYGDSTGFAITASSQTLTAETAFSFDVVYEDTKLGISQSITVQARFIPASIHGKWFHIKMITQSAGNPPTETVINNGAYVLFGADGKTSYTNGDNSPNNGWATDYVFDPAKKELKFYKNTVLQSTFTVSELNETTLNIFVLSGGTRAEYQFSK